MPFSFNPGQEQPNANKGEDTSYTYKNREGDDVDWIKTTLIIILVIVSVIMLGLFGYNYYLNNAIESKKVTLSKYEGSLKGINLTEIQDLSNKLKIANKLVKEHPYISAALKIVEYSTENGVTYNSFDTRFVDAAGNYTLDLAGTAPDYKTVAQQIDTLKRAPYSTYISNVEIKTLIPDRTGKISFMLHMIISIKGVDSVSVDETMGQAGVANDLLSNSTSSVQIGTTTNNFINPVIPKKP